MKRSLTLRSETLAELSADEMSGVVGGARSGLTCPARDCMNSVVICYSWACPTE